MKIQYLMRMLCCMLCIQAFQFTYSQQNVHANDSNFISPAKADRMRRNFKIYIQNPSDENLALAQDIVNALRQDSSKQSLMSALQKKLDAIKANIMPTIAQSTPLKPDNANIIDTMAIIRTSAVEMANHIIDERISHYESIHKLKEEMQRNNELMLARLNTEQALMLQEKKHTSQEIEKNKKLSEAVHALEQQIQGLHTKNDAIVSELTQELTASKRNVTAAQATIAQQQLLIEQEQALAKKAEEKNQQLTQSIAELEHHIQDLHTNNETVISKLESRIETAEKQAYAVELALTNHIQELKHERVAKMNTDAWLNHWSYNNARQAFATELGKAHAIVAQKTAQATQEAAKNKELQHVVQDLENKINYLRSNYENVIAKLESRAEKAEQLTHIFETAQIQHAKHAKEERLQQLKHELSFVNYQNTQGALKTALQQKQTIANQEAEKNKKLQASVKHLENQITQMRANHAMVLSQLQSLLRTTNNQATQFQTTESEHTNNLTDPRISWLNIP